jgi:hypothetical protein
MVLLHHIFFSLSAMVLLFFCLMLSVCTGAAFVIGH